MTEFVTRDSGKRQDYESGMRRDIQEGKPRFDLVMAEGLPFSDQMLTRWAALMERGADKYGERNWELASSEEEYRRFKASAFRHLIQWLTGDTPEEDHAAAVFFNIAAAEYVGGGTAPEMPRTTMPVYAEVPTTVTIPNDDPLWLGHCGACGFAVYREPHAWQVGESGTYYHAGCLFYD